jgi:penicillin-insensitive murein endopeptidase
MRLATVLIAVTAILAGAASWGARAADAIRPAKELFGAQPTPAALASRAIGFYARGCLAGAVALAVDGPGWQVMRLSRNRNWGHPALVDFLERFATAAKTEGWPGLLVGDMAQPRGGPMLTGHASHQIGLDADIWLTPMPDRTLSAEERENITASSMIAPETRVANLNLFTPAHVTLIRRAALFPEVSRIFVHPGIKKALCQGADGDRAWLSKVRPWWGHDSHFHVRLECPEGETLCRDQDTPPEGDGCGKELAWWLSEVPWTPTTPAPSASKPLTMADLPKECRTVLEAR